MSIKLVNVGDFEAENHYYPRALNAQIHSLITFFLNLDNERIINRYCHFYPNVDPNVLRSILNYKAKHFRWSGADLFHVTTGKGNRRMILIETNSCPSGQKSMPLLVSSQEHGGYHELLTKTFIPLYLKRKKTLPKGSLAVIYDKNDMEAWGYACTLADATQEKVYLVKFEDDKESYDKIKFENGILLINDEEKWRPIKAAFRYVTQRPWNRIPIFTKTFIFNPIIACLSGGRNKLVASKAYEFLNAELEGTGLEIRTPETIQDLSIEAIPLWVERMGGSAVIKNPYSNAGQGVWTITNQQELDEFMKLDHRYDKFIVQSLIGAPNWSSKGKMGLYYHVGTVPNKKNEIFVADIRMMVHNTANGFRPLAIYARRAHNPLPQNLDPDMSSWSILGTNLSIKNTDGKWDSETNRLLLMDQRDFNKLGIGLDELIEGYIQTVLATVAIDKMSQKLLPSPGTFDKNLFLSLNPDESLLKEIEMATKIPESP